MHGAFARRAWVPVKVLDLYRRRLLIQAKLRAVQIKQLPDDALPVFEERIYLACKASALRPDSVPASPRRRARQQRTQDCEVGRLTLLYARSYCSRQTRSNS
jgi:hypothetical protein